MDQRAALTSYRTERVGSAVGMLAIDLLDRLLYFLLAVIVGTDIQTYSSDIGRVLWTERSADPCLSHDGVAYSTVRFTSMLRVVYYLYIEY